METSWWDFVKKLALLIAVLHLSVVRVKSEL